MTRDGLVELEKVLALLEEATPGPWLDHGFHDDGIDGERIIAQHVTEAMGYAVACALPCGEPDTRPALTEANAQAIAAAVNFLREHGAALRDGARDAERLDWLAMHGRSVRRMSGRNETLIRWASCIPTAVADPRLNLRLTIDAAAGVGGG